MDEAVYSDTPDSLTTCPVLERIFSKNSEYESTQKSTTFVHSNNKLGEAKFKAPCRVQPLQRKQNAVMLVTELTTRGGDAPIITEWQGLRESEET